MSRYSLFIITFLFWGMFTPSFAYIDPGTGSMLFSVFVGVLTTLFFVFNTLFLKLKMLLASKSSEKLTNEKIVIYSEGRQYYCVFKPILDEFEKRKVPITFFTSDENDPFFKDKYDYVKGSYIGKGYGAYFKLAMLRCDVCLMTTPQLDVLQLKRSKYVKHYCHIFHSVSFSMDYRLFALDYYDSVICDGDFQIPLIREIERKRNLPSKELVVAGSTYMDYYSERLKDLKTPQKDKYTVLIAPTWGKDGLFNKLGDKVIEVLKDRDYDIIIRPHPQSLLVEKDLIEKIAEKYKNYDNISWNYDTDNLSVLSKSDIMISDFSCVMFDYAFLFNRPFLFFRTQENFEIYDVSDLDEIPFRYRVMGEIGHEIKPDETDKIPEIIEKFRTVSDTSKIERARDTAWMHRGEAAKRVADFLISRQEEVRDK